MYIMLLIVICIYLIIIYLSYHPLIDICFVFHLIKYKYRGYFFNSCLLNMSKLKEQVDKKQEHTRMITYEI